MASLSNECVTHPPRSNPPLRSSSGPPSPCITPSTETIVVVVSFMIAVPFSLVVVVRFDRTTAPMDQFTGSGQPDRGGSATGTGERHVRDSAGRGGGLDLVVLLEALQSVPEADASAEQA